ncbi:MAG TPA: YCF48-related protein [Pirellulaceae bacterium]|nr:YCF48-related protein [Pirellulaceae bacterium]
MTNSIRNPQSAIRNWPLSLCISLAASAALAQPDPSPPEMREDAELTAVTFLNADRGWAVGDRGVIWHTIDGGRSWKQQESGVTCRLESVQFLDSDNGWAAGGWTQPYTHETHGVVLRTRDGGKTWQNTPGLTLPGLARLKMLDPKWGWAVGSRSHLYPSGAFFTDDGGRTWTPVVKGETAGWVTGDFADHRGGVVVGLDGSIALVTAKELRGIHSPNTGLRLVRRLLLAGSKLGPGELPVDPARDAPGPGLVPAKKAEQGWLVGDGGLVLTTADGGITWSEPAGKVPEFTAANLDFRALAAFGSHIWIAGAPGTCVLHSADGGQSWDCFRTEQTAPLAGLCFIDEYRGWAVGALGTILHTRDSGQTWRLQHSGGKRVGMLGVFAEPERIPLELIGLVSGSDAYLSAIEIIGRQPDDLTAPARTHAALLAAGGSHADTAWQFPLAERGLPQSPASILARWNALCEGRATERLEEHIVRRIRQWQPEVIVTEDVSPRGDDPLAHLTNQITLAAVQKAGELTAYPDQVTHAGLLPWRVKKVLTLVPGAKPGLINITPAQWAPRIGRSLADVAEGGRGLIRSDVVPAARNIGLSLLVDHLPQETGRRDVMSGITLDPGSEARRQLSHPPAGDLEQLGRLAQKRHNVEQLLARIDGGGANLGNWLGQVDELTRGLPARQSGEILWQLGQRYHQAGRGDSAAEALELLVQKHPQHPLADRAALWLVQYYASGEMAWRERKQNGANFGVAAASQPADSPTAVKPAAATQAVAIAAPIQASFDSMQRMGHVSSNMTPAQRSGRALALANQIQRTRPTLYADPALRFPLAVAMRGSEPGDSSPLSPRGRGAGGEGARLLQTLPQLGPANPWTANLAAEEWLVSSRADAPKKLLSVVSASEKPKLDGRLDDALWQSAKAVSLTPTRRASEATATRSVSEATVTRSVSEGGHQPTPEPADLFTAAVLAFDDEFLYVAVSCQKAPGCEYPADSKPRIADEDLSQTDHVTLLLDIDRDYTTYWRLSFDHRGRPAESCFGDATWNPQWYVAAAGDETYWTVEAAIPLAELAERKPEVRDVWSANIQRVIPGIGLQSSSQPAGIEIRPEGFGLLVFE